MAERYNAGDGGGSARSRSRSTARYALKHITHGKAAHLRRLRAARFHVVQIPRPGAPALEGGGGKGKAPAAEVVETPEEVERKMRADEVSLPSSRTRDGRPQEWEGNKDQARVGREVGGNEAESTYVLLRARERAPDEAAGAGRARGEIMEILRGRGPRVRGRITCKTLTLEEAEELSLKLRTGEERFDRIARKGGGGAGRRRGGGGGGGSDSTSTCGAHGRRTSAARRARTWSRRRGATASTSRRTTTASTTTTTTPARRTTTGRAGRAPGRSGAAVWCSTRLTSSRWKWRRRRPATATIRTGVSRRRAGKNDEGSLWTHFKGEKGEDRLEGGAPYGLKAKRERGLGSDDEDDDDDDESELGDEGAQVLHEVSTGLTQFKAERLGPEEVAAAAARAEGGESSAAERSGARRWRRTPETRYGRAKLVTEKDIVDVINEAGRIQIKILIAQFKGAHRQERRGGIVAVASSWRGSGDRAERKGRGGRQVGHLRRVEAERSTCYVLKPRESVSR